MRILFLGDIVGRSGREAVLAGVRKWRTQLALDVIVANAENASHGFGLLPEHARELFACGVDAITLGNHSWDKRELIGQISHFPNLIRPLNFPSGTPGQGSCLLTLPRGHKILVVNLMGRVFMNMVVDDPFRSLAELLSRYRLGKTVQAIVVDIHAETTSEKTGIGTFFDGHVSLVVGTHTHVPTADYRILPNGTAYQTDAGMCGDYDSIIGMEKTRALARLLGKVPSERNRPAEGQASLCGLLVETDDDSGLALSVAPLRLGGLLSENFP